MHDFENKTLDDIIKSAQVEVLLNQIAVTEKGDQVYPVKCPGVGRKQDFLKDDNQESVCALGNQRCKYFQSAEFNLEDYTKRIFCNVINVEDIKGK